MPLVCLQLSWQMCALVALKPFHADERKFLADDDEVLNPTEEQKKKAVELLRQKGFWGVMCHPDIPFTRFPYMHDPTAPLTRVLHPQVLSARTVMHNYAQVLKWVSHHIHALRIVTNCYESLRIVWLTAWLWFCFVFFYLW
jgi:GMP synthase-like glutamine amidotransferase